MASVGMVYLVLVGILVVQAMADQSEVNPSENKVKSESGVADQPASSPAPTESSGESREAEGPEIRRLGKHHSDKSVAGGGVIIGGLVTTIFAAVFCYIRVTRKKDGGH